MKPTAILLLAAGESRRMGAPKQLLDIDGRKLIEIVLARLVALPDAEVFVVLGAYADQIAPLVRNFPAQIILNEKWPDGMGSSIAAGMTVIREESRLDHVLICLVDQPQLETQHYAALLAEAAEYPHTIVAAEYAGRPGVPAVFPRSQFEKLLNASGDHGARSWLRSPGTRLRTIAMPEAAIDWDRPEDMREDQPA